MEDGVRLPADGHVHTEWSWDAWLGSMERTCARAVELGLPAVAFTEHADYSPWVVDDGQLDHEPFLARLVGADGRLRQPALDVEGYLESLQRCRQLFPGLRIISGVELGEPHRNRDVVGELLAAGGFERILGSLHTLAVGDAFAEPVQLYRHRPAAEVLREYLGEAARMVATCDEFAVLAHLDYPLRYWPESAGPLDPRAFEAEFREVLALLADSGRVLEINTKLPMDPVFVRWWHDEGGDAVTFGSDAHEPAALARGLRDAAAMAEAFGFRPTRHPYDVWRRAD
jgi:histidinol-phosphatase (PHP family)